MITIYFFAWLQIGDVLLRAIDENHRMARKILADTDTQTRQGTEAALSRHIAKTAAIPSLLDETYIAVLRSIISSGDMVTSESACTVLGNTALTPQHQTELDLLAVCSEICSVALLYLGTEEAQHND